MKKRKTSPKKIERKEEAKAVSVDDLIHEADSALEASDVQKAASLYAGAASLLRGKLQLVRDDHASANANAILLANVLGRLGEAKVSMGDPSGAREEFASAIAVLPQRRKKATITPTDGEDDDLSGVSKLHEMRAGLFLYLGQLSSEEEALASYTKGVEELESCVQLRGQLITKNEDAMETDQAQNKETTLAETRRQLSSAYCSIAELYLTDLCYEENAEEECESAIQSALRIVDEVDGQPNADALQAMANLRLSQRRAMDASQHVLEAYQKMSTGCEALATLVGMRLDAEGGGEEKAAELIEVDAANSLPGFEFRCQTVKILLECASVLKETTEEGDSSSTATELPDKCATAAVHVAGSLMAENDEVVEIWFLAGCAFASLVPSKAELAAQYFERAMEMLLQVKNDLEAEVSEGSDDAEDQLVEVNEQIDEIRCKVNQLGAN